MMSLLKNIFVLLGLLLLAGLGYYLFVLEKDSNLDNSSASFRESEAEVQQFVKLLEDVESINLPMTIFSDERFRSFNDFSTPIERVESGRDNPFSN